MSIFAFWVVSLTQSSYWVAPFTAVQLKLGVEVAIVPLGATSGAAPGTMVHENDAEAVVVPSDTVMLLVNTPAAVGVPVMAPLDGLIERPVGKLAAVNVRGLASGSVAVIESDTATPVAPDWFPGLVTTGGRFVFDTVQVNVFESDPPVAAAVTTTVCVPALEYDKVPEITPVAAFTVSDGGNPVAEYVIASPSGSVAERATDTTSFS